MGGGLDDEGRRGRKALKRWKKKSASDMKTVSWERATKAGASYKQLPGFSSGHGQWGHAYIVHVLGICKAVPPS